MDNVYDLFQAGTALLEEGDLPRRRGAAEAGRGPRSGQDLDPRGARPGATSAHSQYEAAAAEFEAVVERAPTNDFALFCLGRSLMQLGRHREARQPLALAANLRPERADYRRYRDLSRRGRPEPPAPRSALS